MQAFDNTPIVAIATAPGRGAVGIVRVSGPSVQPLIDAVCGRALKAREATYLPFHASDGSVIDQGLALYFPSPNSYTGEDVLEIQAHGGPVVLQLLVSRCLEAAAEFNPDRQTARLPGLRLARPGEFTQRAFLNDKLDLAQAEAVADLIDASTEAAARSASRSLAGGFSKEIYVLREALIKLRMLVEATLDFPEEDIDFLQKADAAGQLSGLQDALGRVMQKARQGALLREGIKVVIAGQPNAGKSSLLNALAGAELAIVTPIPGTTRDKVQQTIQIEGVPIHVIDTAGLRDSDDDVEKIGIARTWTEIQTADAVVFLHDLTRMNAIEYIAKNQELAGTLALKIQKNVPVIDVWNKADAVDGEWGSQDVREQGDGPDGLLLSTITGQGLDALRHRMLEVAGWQAGAEGLYMGRERHLLALKKVDEHLSLAANHLKLGQSLDLLAEELRLAQNALGDITGEFTSDDLLGVIFSSFCIGK
jgi:tRNA modification GTPase